MPEPLPGPDPRLAWVWAKDAWRRATIVGDLPEGHVVHTFDGAMWGPVRARFVREAPEGERLPPEPIDLPEGVEAPKGPGFLDG